VTSKGATGNKTGVGGRTIWHSDQRCVEVLCRVRTPLDYIDVIKAKSGSGFSDPKGEPERGANEGNEPIELRNTTLYD